MKNLKLILPMLAFICAIGMAFATVDFNPEQLQADPNNDYVLTDNGVVTINEVDCGPGDIGCEARLNEGEPAFPVFDDPALSKRKTGDGTVLEL